jgi:uncharacterized protein
LSQDNVEVIRRAIEAFNSGDVEQMLALVDPALEWRPAFGAATDGGTAYTGHAGFREYWRGTQDVWDHFHFSPERFVDDDENVVVIGRGSGRAKGSGVEIDQPFAMLWKVRAGKVVFGQTFTDHGAASKPWGWRSSAITQNLLESPGPKLAGCTCRHR